MQMSFDYLNELYGDGKKRILAHDPLTSNNLVFAFDCFHQAACKDNSKNLNETIHI